MQTASRCIYEKKCNLLRSLKLAEIVNVENFIFVVPNTHALFFERDTPSDPMERGDSRRHHSRITFFFSRLPPLPCLNMKSRWNVIPTAMDNLYFDKAQQELYRTVFGVACEYQKCCST